MKNLSLCTKRPLCISKNVASKYKFYDLIKQSNRHPKHEVSPVSLIEKIENREEQMQRPSKSMAFEGNYNKDDLTPEERIARVFGGRIRGEDRQSSSRINVGEPRIIAGVKVPDKPVEPDNCCMSGCINCVWEIYNDDVKDWNMKRKKAAQNMVQNGGKWPADFHPPIEMLKPENLPQSLATKANMDKAGKGDEPWEKVPVQIRVFAETEKRLKAKKKASAAT